MEGKGMWDLLLFRFFPSHSHSIVQDSPAPGKSRRQLRYFLPHKFLGGGCWGDLFWGR